ncbi:hypothetical protein [Actinomadura sp. WMMB 499]|uniref:hypothetical protein n=1 Tax=Actinomadura sp. WMMB 499 TaxID=1219491 RepID=UPI0012444245|nr:hypothetical protein [Actinomadura sp. WMMB 499]QFG25427.1 hypothetical protein F7P10_33985 [Actinomadura sp. WMMB 499]
MGNAIVKSFFPGRFEHCYRGHPLPAGAGPVGFRVGHDHQDEDGEGSDDKPLKTCSVHLADAVRKKEKEGRELEEGDAFEDAWL